MSFLSYSGVVFSAALLIFGIIGLINMYKRRKYKPQVGDRLCRRNAMTNPFERIELEVVAVKEGWVQYSFVPVGMRSSTYSDTVSNIREYYTKIN